MASISKTLTEKAEATINDLVETGETESKIKDAPGFIVIKNDHLSEGLMPLKNITVDNCKFTVCADRRKKEQEAN